MTRYIAHGRRVYAEIPVAFADYKDSDGMGWRKTPYRPLTKRGAKRIAEKRTLETSGQLEPPPWEVES